MIEIKQVDPVDVAANIIATVCDGDRQSPFRSLSIETMARLYLTSTLFKRRKLRLVPSELAE